LQLTLLELILFLQLHFPFLYILSLNKNTNKV
jgi:hypothetical protein